MKAHSKPPLGERLKQLRLAAFAQNSASVAAVAGKEGWSYEEYLLSLCEMELAERERRKKQRLLKASRLPREKTLSIFDRKRLSRNVDKQLAGRRLP